jgi:prepilin-type N-terminal cleavage/methylation domain-containing protein
MVAAAATQIGHMRGPKKERGFTLIEVLVAAMLLVVALVGSIGLILGMARANQSNRTRDVGYLIAQEAVEQLSAVPLLTLATNNPAATSVPSAPTCYGMSDDAVVDRPIPCSGAAAYYLRTWVCCSLNPPTLPAVPIIGVQCNVAVNNPPAGQVVSPDQVNGGIACLIEAEVTWTNEDTVANGAASPAAASGYFVDPPTAPPVAINKVLSFTNHVFLSEVREQ